MKSTHPLNKELGTLSGIVDMAQAFQKSKVLLTACELDIFSILSNESKTVKEISHEIDTDERATERLLNALCGIGFLKKSADMYSNARGSLWYLVKDSPDYIGDMSFLTRMWGPYGSLTDIVRLGQGKKDIQLWRGNEEELEKCIASERWRALKEAPELISMIDLNKVSKVLDLGCGSGTYAIELAKAKPELEIVVFDYPEVINITKKYIEEKGLSGKIGAIAGDFFVDEIGVGYDLVFLSSVMQRHSLWDNIRLGQIVYKALNKNGSIILHEPVLDDDRTLPLDAALQSLTMLLSSVGGEVYTSTDIWITLKEAWFRNVKHKTTSFGARLIRAVK